MVYIATFFSHYGAMQFTRKLKSCGIEAKMMPVPRRLSSSCGTGVRFEVDGKDAAVNLADENVDKMFQTERDVHTQIFDSQA